MDLPSLTSNPIRLPARAFTVWVEALSRPVKTSVTVGVVENHPLRTPYVPPTQSRAEFLEIGGSVGSVRAIPGPPRLDPPSTSPIAELPPIPIPPPFSESPPQPEPLVTLPSAPLSPQFPSLLMSDPILSLTPLALPANGFTVWTMKRPETVASPIAASISPTLYRLPGNAFTVWTSTPHTAKSAAPAAVAVPAPVSAPVEKPSVSEGAPESKPTPLGTSVPSGVDDGSRGGGIWKFAAALGLLLFGYKAIQSSDRQTQLEAAQVSASGLQAELATLRDTAITAERTLNEKAIKAESTLAATTAELEKFAQKLKTAETKLAQTEASLQSAKRTQAEAEIARTEASKALAEKETALNNTISGLKEELSKLRRETSDQDASAKSAMAKMEQDRAAALKELADLQAKMREIQATPKP